MTYVSHWLVTGACVAELALILKVTVAAAAGLLAVRFSPRASAAVRHHILASTFVALLILPLAGLLVPPVAIEVPVSGAADAPASLEEAMAAARVAQSQSTVARTAAPDLRRQLPEPALIAQAVWAAGTLLLLFGLVRAAWRFDRLRRRGLPWTATHAHAILRAAASGIGRRVELLLHEELSAPATWGWRRPVILLPMDATEWSDGDLRRALVHELEHVRRGDLVAQLMARAVCALYWFHPLAWIALRRLRIEAERACDDAVLRQAESTDYAEQLVQLARRMSTGATEEPTLAMADRTDLSTRVAAILDASQARGRLGVLPAAAAVLTAAALAAGVAPMRARAVSAADSVLAAAADRAGAPAPVSAKDRALYEAAEHGDVAEISSLLTAGADVNAAIDGDGSPLIGAVRSGRIDAVTLLLDRGADVNMIVRGDGSPLVMAAAAGDLPVIELLLDRGAAIDLVAPDDENALMQASGNGHLRAVELLVARGADVNARAWADTVSFGGGTVRVDGEWRTPLGMARRGGHDAVVDYLMAAGARE